MADFSKLKSTAEKGSPPGPKVTNANLKEPPRETPAKGVRKTKIEFSVPDNVADRFAREAGERFGFRKGSKSNLFLAMFREYLERKGDG